MSEPRPTLYASRLSERATPRIGLETPLRARAMIDTLAAAPLFTGARSLADAQSEEGGSPT